MVVKELTRGFRLGKIRFDLPFCLDWETEPNPAVNEILSQPFKYLNKGTQCYVFESRDGQFVIKLFRSTSKDKVLFDACKMAYDHLREETGLIYVHLNPTPMNLPILHCKDAIGRKIQIPLDQYRFALQKKAEPLRDALLRAHGNSAQMKKRLDDFLQLLSLRTAKGIVNADSNLSRNFGFLDDRAIEIDFGNYRQSSGDDRQAEMKRYVQKLQVWLEKNDPAWVPYLNEQWEKSK